MGTYTCDIFIDSQEAPEEFAKNIEDILNIPFKIAPPQTVIRVLPPTPDLYVDDDESTERWLIIKHHSLENDGDRLFEDYNYRLEVGSTGVNLDLSTSARAARAQLFAREIFEILKASRRFKLMMVYDLERKLDEFDPYSAHPNLEDH